MCVCLIHRVFIRQIFHSNFSSEFQNIPYQMMNRTKLDERLTKIDHNLKTQPNKANLTIKHSIIYYYILDETPKPTWNNLMQPIPKIARIIYKKFAFLKFGWKLLWMKNPGAVCPSTWLWEILKHVYNLWF